MRRAARKDANHNEIADAFRKLGCSVLDLSQLGNGCPDLLVSNRFTALVEVKTKKGKLTKDQEEFHANWRGAYFVVRDVAGVPWIAHNLRGFT